MNIKSKIKGKIADKKINALGVLVFLIFLSIAPVQARSVIIDSCPSGATVYKGGIMTSNIIGVTPFSYEAPSVQSNIMFKKAYYGWALGYVGPASPDYFSQPMYYWGEEPGNTKSPGWNYCSQVNPYTKAPAPTSTPYKAPAPTPTPYKAPAPTPTQISGSATIDSTPSGAVVYLRTYSGEIKIGVTPFVYTLPSQQSVIVFKKSGYSNKIAYISPTTNSPFVVKFY